MREIKFRAWNQKLNCMSEVLEIDFQHNAIRCIPGHLPKNKLSDVDIMQFTGLLDKNGKEIYEGDIMKITTTFHSFNVSVIWSEDCWTFSADGEYGTLSEWNKTSEVVGNIYQNKELL